MNQLQGDGESTHVQPKDRGAGARSDLGRLVARNSFSDRTRKRPGTATAPAPAARPSNPAAASALLARDLQDFLELILSVLLVVAVVIRLCAK